MPRELKHETPAKEVSNRFDCCRDVEHVLKVGREFQMQDSWRGAHYDTAKLLCDTIEYLYERLNSPIGNMAAMRATLVNLTRPTETDIRGLENIAKYAMDHSMYGGGVLQALCGAIREGKLALADPPRNCDRFGGDPKMLHTAWFDWSGSPSGCNPDGTVKLTFGEWLLATEKKGGAM